MKLYGSQVEGIAMDRQLLTYCRMGAAHNKGFDWNKSQKNSYFREKPTD